MLKNCDKINLRENSAIVQESIIPYTLDIKYLIALK